MASSVRLFFERACLEVNEKKRVIRCGSFFGLDEVVRLFWRRSASGNCSTVLFFQILLHRTHHAPDKGPFFGLSSYKNRAFKEHVKQDLRRKKQLN
jgi:hypothetical protein